MEPCEYSIQPGSSGSMEVEYDVSSPAGEAVLSISTIVDILYPQLSVADIVSLSKVCKSTYYAVKAWLPSAYNINSYLKRFLGNLDNVLAFRSLQASTGTIISGSQALQFFDRVHYPESDLDIYVNCRHAVTIGKFLLSIGYEYESNTQKSGSYDCLERLTKLASTKQRNNLPGHGANMAYTWRFVEGVVNFIKLDLNEIGTLKIQLITIEPRSSPLTCVLQYHSTLVMNLITHDRAYSLFPYATFIRRVGVTFIGSEGQAIRKAYNKYMKRNFKISDDLLFLPYQNSLISFGDRWVGDRQTWTIELNMTDVKVPNWVQHSNSYPGHPLLSLQGFSILNHEPAHPSVTNPVPESYTKGTTLLSFESIYSNVLRHSLVLPICNNLTYWDEEFGTSYPSTYRFLEHQQRFEEQKIKRSFPRLALRPEMLPGWIFWDTEALLSARNEHAQRKESMVHWY